jgi:hypothetical protein
MASSITSIAKITTKHLHDIYWKVQPFKDGGLLLSPKSECKKILIILRLSGGTMIILRLSGGTIIFEILSLFGE